ncbi:MAG: hypothetical protein KGJ07_00495 [Patescibacteria group bacterium]|nr:hypothetical protein [Patescibacteria group bacterium]
MDDDFNFDWRNTPMKEHPEGMNCQCPKHLEIKENIMMNQGTLKMKLCKDHYRVYFKEIFPQFPFTLRFVAKICLKLRIIQIKEIPLMQSDQCFYCKFGSGGHEINPELPPIA